MDQELKKRRGDKGDSQKRNEAAQKKRQRNAKARKKLPTEEVVHDVDDDHACPNCGGTKVPAGTHRLRFVNPNGISESRDVTVRAGALTKVRLRF